MQLRVLAFGDLADGSWGAVWIPSEPDQAGLLGSWAGSGDTAHELEGERADEPWRLSAGETELTWEALGESVPTDVQETGFDQLCRVTGVLDSVSGRRNIRCLGWRAARSEPLTAGRLDSLRLLAAWFEQEEGFALLAARPEGGRGAERDQITAALFSAAGTQPVADPRLSTTYDSSEQPMRASVELWIETEGDSEAQYPRRAIGEAVSAQESARAGTLVLHGGPFRWYSGGLEGAGIYVIARPA